MATSNYIAFLRGINVGGIRIKMNDLKMAFEQVGCANVQTYLQTGNVVFEVSQSIGVIKSVLEQKLTKSFDYEAFVLIYTLGELQEIVGQYPFEPTEIHHDYVVFIENELVLNELKQAAEEVRQEADSIAFGSRVCYWKVPKGESTNTAFSKILGKAKYKSTTTVRNLNTLQKIVS